MNELGYWKECISIAADECDLTLTAEQLESIAYSVKGGHENYGMAFYAPRCERLFPNRVATEGCRRGLPDVWQVTGG